MERGDDREQILPEMVHPHLLRGPAPAIPAPPVADVMEVAGHG